MDTNQGDAYQEVKRSWPAETQRVRQTLNPARYHSSILGRNEQRWQSLCKKELLEAYEQASRAWLARVQFEVVLWSELATKLIATRSVPEALEAYTKCVSQRMQMTAEDGQRVFKDCQQITQKITKSLTNGWPSGST
jgi:hypothetical protein